MIRKTNFISIATMAALSATLWSGPALAACLVEGTLLRSLPAAAEDQTGSTLYIKTSPGDYHYSYVRLRDGAFLRHINGDLGLVKVRVLGDAVSCPQEGIIRDAGTALGEPEILEFVRQTARGE